MSDAILEYLRMGGYAFHVWWSYAIVVAVLALNLIAPSLRHRRMRRALARQARFEDPAHNDP